MNTPNSKKTMKYRHEFISMIDINEISHTCGAFFLYTYLLFEFRHDRHFWGNSGSAAIVGCLDARGPQLTGGRRRRRRRRRRGGVGGGEEKGGGGEGGGTEQGLLCGVVTFLRGPNNQLMLELGEDHKEGKRVWLMATAPVPQY